MDAMSAECMEFFSLKAFKDMAS